MIVTCPVCKTKFEPTEDWGYAFGKRDVCSYHCMRSLERDHQRGLLEEPKKITDTNRKMAWQMHEAGMRWDEIAEKLGYQNPKSAANSAFKWRREELIREAEEIAAYEAACREAAV